jgi:hypothetical protein
MFEIIFNGTSHLGCQDVGVTNAHPVYEIPPLEYVKYAAVGVSTISVGHCRGVRHSPCNEC